MQTNQSKDIYQAIADECARSRDFAVATVLKAVGSTPNKAGAKAIINSGGAIRGTIGGGAVEAQAQRTAIESIKNRQPFVFDFNLEGSAVSDKNPICGGMMRVLIDPVPAQHKSAYVAAAEARQCRQRGLLLTMLQGDKSLESANPPDTKVVFYSEAEISETTFSTAEMLRCILTSGETTLLVKETLQEGLCLEVLVEPLIPNPLLLIVGGGHIGQALALQASILGFDILVLDDRNEFTAAELFPEAVSTCCGRIDEEIGRLQIAIDTYIVIVTRDHRNDAEALAACLNKPAAYIGMIGSRRKVELMRKEFVESGRSTVDEFARIYAPIGLDIGAKTVPEIAASIAAQLIAVRRKGAAARISSK
jgi:xanthine dehydrogenase accessory factor